MSLTASDEGQSLMGEVHFTLNCYVSSITWNNFEDANSDLYSSPPLLVEDTFQDPQWMPETTDRTVFYIVCFFFYIYILMIKFYL